MKQIFFTFLIFLSLSAAAQKTDRVHLSAGAEIAGVTGNLSNFYSLAAGASLQADFKVDKDAALTVYTGLIDFIGRKIDGTDLKYRSEVLIPLLAGVKYYFIPKLYGSAQIGGSFSTRSGNGKSSAFTYAPGLGYRIDEDIDILLKYTGYSDRGGTFGIRLGYTIY